MLRRTPLRRTHPMARGRIRPGAAARRRIQAGGVLAQGRLAATAAEWKAIVEQLMARCGGRCEACHRVRPLEPHHVKKRSQGGEDALWNLVALCGGPDGCHAATDRPFCQGRLVVERRAGGSFRFLTEWAVDKFEARARG